MMIGWKIRKNCCAVVNLVFMQKLHNSWVYLISDPVKRCGGMQFRSDDEIGFGSESLTS